MDLMLLRFGKGERGTFPTPEEVAQYQFTPQDEAHISHNRGRVISGTQAQIKAQLIRLAADYEVEELVIVTITADFQDRLRSYELLAEAFELGQEVGSEVEAAVGY